MKTEIVNTTTNLVVIREGIVFREGIFPIGTGVTDIPPNTTFILQHDPRETYCNLFFFESKPGNPVELDVEEADEIRIYELPGCSKLGWRISKRSKSSGNYKDDDSADVNSLKENACSRMKLIDVSCIGLGKLQNGVKICTAQCKNLVETCLEGIEHMKATYDTVIENDDHVWELYSSKKLRYLIRSLDKLLFILETIEDLMRACERQWCRMGLYVSTIPFALSEKKTITKFDILLKELSWTLDTIHYVLALSESAGLEWNEDECRYVLLSDSGASVSGATDSGATDAGATDVGATDAGATDSGASEVATTETGLIGTKCLYREDRAHLLIQIENGSFPGDEICFLQTRCLPLIVMANLFRGIYATNFGIRHYFAREVLKARLQDYNHDADAVPDCFQINPLHLDINEELSAGNLHKIYSGKWRGEDVAIRVTWHRDQGSMLESVKQESQKEASLILKVQHPNIVEFYGYACTDNAPPPVSSVKDKDPVSASYLVMELMQGDLRREIRRLTRKKPGRPFPDDVTVDILLQIVEAMSHMHDSGVIYRDLKASNCLVNPRLPSKSDLDVCKFYTVKLADFDTSKMLDAGITHHTRRQGTTRWMAPEVWGIGDYCQGTTRQTSTYDKSIDVYSFGMTCYEVISGEVPFYERGNREIESALKKEERPVLPRGITCTKSFVDLMSRCWSQEPSDRPDFNEIRKVLWTVKYEVEYQ